MDRKTNRMLLLPFMLLGLIFLVVGLGFAAYDHSIRANSFAVQGTIVGFEDHDPVVLYRINGADYTTTGSISTSGQAIGDPYTLYVDTNDPLQVTDEVFYIIGLSFAISGGVFWLMGFLFWAAVGRATSNREALLGYGRRVTAVVTSVTENRAVSYGKQHPWRITATCTHPLTGQTVQVKSHSVLFTTLQPGDQVEIAFHPSNEKKYAFDLREERMA